MPRQRPRSPWCMRTNPAWNPTRFARRVGLTAATPYQHAGDRGHHPAHGVVRSDLIRARLPKLACRHGAGHHGEYHGDGAAGRCRRAADSVRRACRGRHRDVVRRRHRPGRLQAAGEPRPAHRAGGAHWRKHARAQGCCHPARRRRQGHRVDGRGVPGVHGHDGDFGFRVGSRHRHRPQRTVRRTVTRVPMAAAAHALRARHELHVLDADGVHGGHRARVHAGHRHRERRLAAGPAVRRIRGGGAHAGDAAADRHRLPVPGRADDGLRQGHRQAARRHRDAGRHGRAVRRQDRHTYQRRHQARPGAEHERVELVLRAACGMADHTDSPHDEQSVG